MKSLGVGAEPEGLCSLIQRNLCWCELGFFGSQRRKFEYLGELRSDIA